MQELYILLSPMPPQERQSKIEDSMLFGFATIKIAFTPVEDGIEDGLCMPYIASAECDKPISPDALIVGYIYVLSSLLSLLGKETLMQGHRLIDLQKFLNEGLERHKEAQKIGKDSPEWVEKIWSLYDKRSED